jgi:hypothetical protein
MQAASATMGLWKPSAKCQAPKSEQFPYKRSADFISLLTPLLKNPAFDQFDHDVRFQAST